MINNKPKHEKTLKDLTSAELDAMIERMRQRGELDKNWWRM